MGRETGAGAHLERGDGLVAAHTHLLAVRTGEHRGDGAVFGMLQIRPSVVERLLGEQRVLTQVVLGAVHRLGAGRNEVLVDGDMRAPARSGCTWRWWASISSP